jgi:hypothetical protein
MIHLVVHEVAPLTKTLQIAKLVMRRVVVQMSGTQEYECLPHRDCFLDIGPIGKLAAPSSPSPLRGIKPPAVTQAPDHLSMRAPACLALSACKRETHLSANFLPVCRVETTEFALDWHLSNELALTKR